MQPVDLKITDENGWSKSVKLTKAITLVGRAITCDIQLNSIKIPLIQMQILCSTDLPTGCRLVNLSDSVVVSSNGVPATIDQFASYDVRHQDEMGLGDYHILFELPLSTNFVQKTSSMEAALSFSNAVLRPEFPLEGKLIVTNVGKRKETQFQVDLQGLPPDCYLIDPIPLLYPGAQEEIRLRLFHKLLYPEVGIHPIFIIVTAPNSYPGEELSIAQNIYVLPVFNQKLEVLDDIADLQSAKKQEKSKVDGIAESEPLPQFETAVVIEKSIQASTSESQKEPTPLPEWPFVQAPLVETPKLDSIDVARNSSSPVESFKLAEESTIVQTPSIIPEVIPEKNPDNEMQALVEKVPPRTDPDPSSQPVQIVAATAVKEEEEVFEAPSPQPQPSLQTIDRSKLKVMHHPSNDFWNED